MSADVDLFSGELHPSRTNFERCFSTDAFQLKPTDRSMVGFTTRSSPNFIHVYSDLRCHYTGCPAYSSDSVTPTASHQTNTCLCSSNSKFLLGAETANQVRRRFTLSIQNGSASRVSYPASKAFKTHFF
jgi:hypothetical protein